MCLALFFASTLPAAAQQGTLLADAHVSSARPAANSGSLSNLNVGGGYTALLQFDLSALPAGLPAAQLTRATLRLYCNRAYSPGAFSAQLLASSWVESTVTYASLPAQGSTVATAACTAPDQFVTLDITSAVQGWLTAPVTNFGLALTASAAVLQFDSKENDFTGHAPQLDLTTASSSGSGAPGATGATGATGSTGLTGAAGPTGAAGSTGPTGQQGLAGLPGAQGSTGPTGLQGVAGATGIAGAAGTAGAKGATGATGVNGAPGATGSPGLVYQGAYSSLTSYTLGDVVLFAGSSYASLQSSNHNNTPGESLAFWGLLTAQGPIGPAGVAGATGPTGIQGAPGSVGPPGQQGNTGAQGPAGQAGAQGIPGATGATGLQGPAGVAGAAGPVGLNFRGAYDSQTNYAQTDGVQWQGAGYVSLLANNHGNTPSESPTAWALFAASGAAGPAGPQGLPGATGVTGIGLPGATGATGVQGAPGPAGPTGASGPIGATGVQGLPGATGSIGPAGPTGASGLPGAMGATGATGSAGAPGLSFRGAWAATATYTLNDAVTFAGSTYIALAVNANSEPDITPAVWSLLASAGSVGPPGTPGAAGSPGAAATISIAPVTVLPAGSQPTVTNTGTSSAAVLAFGLPAGGGSSSTQPTGSSFAAIYHAVSYNTLYYSLTSPTAAGSETAAVLAWVPRGCTATRLDVYSQQSAPIKVTLRSGTPGNMADTTLLCDLGSLSAASCTVTGSVTVAPGAFLDLRIDNASGTPAGVWTALECN